MVRQLGWTCVWFVASSAAAINPPPVAWNRQFGTANVDQATAVDVDSMGNVYVTGRTSGSLDGPNLGGDDLFLRKYDAAGTLEWNHQFGGAGNDMSWGLTIDPLGDIVVVGDTQSSSTGVEAFVTKFDEDGNHRWTERFFDYLGSQALDVGADAHGNLYVSGATYRSVGRFGARPDGFVTKFSTAGARTWTRQFGDIFNDLAWGVAADASGNIYLSGERQDDVILQKYDADGGFLWESEIATTGYERGHSIAVDELGSIFVAGNSGMDHGGVNYGRFDALVAKYNSDGELSWVRQTGSSDNDGAARIATDGLGNAYIVGFATASLDGVAYGSRDVLVAKYDATGDRVWQQPLGTAEADNGFDVAVDAAGNVYVVGDTLGAFGGANAGSADAFLLKLTEPADSTRSADFDGSGVVDGGDLSSWQSAFGPYHGADADDDSDSDGADFLAWQRQLNGLPIGMTSMNVPEPTAQAVVLISALIIHSLRARPSSRRRCSAEVHAQSHHHEST